MPLARSPNPEWQWQNATGPRPLRVTLVLMSIESDWAVFHSTVEDATKAAYTRRSSADLARGTCLRAMATYNYQFATADDYGVFGLEQRSW